MPSKFMVVGPDYNPYNEQPVYFEKFKDNVRIMSSK